MRIAMERIELRLSQPNEVGTSVAVVADEVVDGGGVAVLVPFGTGLGDGNPCRLGLAPPPFATRGELAVFNLGSLGCDRYRGCDGI